LEAKKKSPDRTNNGINVFFVNTSRFEWNMVPLWKMMKMAGKTKIYTVVGLTGCEGLGSSESRITISNKNPYGNWHQKLPDIHDLSIKMTIVAYDYRFYNR